MRRWAISADVKPAVRRRSKPRGAGVVVEDGASCFVPVEERSVVVSEGLILEASAASASCATLVSALSSEAVRVSPMEQCM